MKQTSLITLVIIAIQLAGCSQESKTTATAPTTTTNNSSAVATQSAEQKSDATSPSPQVQSATNALSAGQASVATTKPEDYHVLDPQSTGFKLVLNLRSLKNDAYQTIVDAELASAFIDNDGSPFAKGQQFPLDLTTNRITDSILSTTKFGNIMIKSDGHSMQVLMMDSQVAMIKKYIGR
jgi:cytoskeletal protein RodZ